MAERIARTHHERWDGDGYPHHLSGEKIPLKGRIAAVVDVFDALAHERPYKSAWPVEEAWDEIRRQSGGQFAPRVVKAFFAVWPLLAEETRPVLMEQIEVSMEPALLN